MGERKRAAGKRRVGPRRRKEDLSALDGRLLKAPERLIFAANLKSQRLAHGWTISEMARRVDADRGYVSRVESGAINVSIDRMAAFAQLFRVPLHELLHPKIVMCDKGRTRNGPMSQPRETIDVSCKGRHSTDE